MSDLFDAAAMYDEDYLHFFAAPPGRSEFAAHGPVVPGTDSSAEAAAGADLAAAGSAPGDERAGPGVRVRGSGQPAGRSRRPGHRPGLLGGLPGPGPRRRGRRRSQRRVRGRGHAPATVGRPLRPGHQLVHGVRVLRRHHQPRRAGRNRPGPAAGRPAGHGPGQPDEVPRLVLPVARRGRPRRRRHARRPLSPGRADQPVRGGAHGHPRRPDPAGELRQTPVRLS